MSNHQTSKNFTVLFNTDIDWAVTDIVATTAAEALAEARAMAADKENLEHLFFEPYDGNFPVNEIAVSDENGGEVARWLDEDLLLRLAARHLLAALRRALTALNTAPRFKVPALDCDSYAVAAECDRAIALTKGGAA